MTTSVQEFLNNFDSLTESDKIDIAIEILKRVIQLEFQPLSDEDLALNAEQLFLELDQEEAIYE